MRTYAQVDENNTVTNVAVFADDNTPPDLGWSNWYETADNTRKTFAGPGYTFVSEAPAYPLGLFYPPCPHNTWVLDENYDWQPPADKPYPEGFGEPPCTMAWDDDLGDWDEKTPSES
tara:strand:+ start:297 stop:647 length:351 start_codon:yes stop_codon:yes gene_type:complete